MESQSSCSHRRNMLVAYSKPLMKPHSSSEQPDKRLCNRVLQFQHVHPDDQWIVWNQPPPYAGCLGSLLLESPIGRITGIYESALHSLSGYLTLVFPSRLLIPVAYLGRWGPRSLPILPGYFRPGLAHIFVQKHIESRLDFLWLVFNLIPSKSRFLWSYKESNFFKCSSYSLFPWKGCSTNKNCLWYFKKGGIL